MGFQDGLKICMWFSRNPETIFYYFFRIFNLDIFWILILQKRIGSRYLVPVTPTTVLSRSFWNFTGALRMVWKYACGFFESWNYFLSLFTHFELRHFLSSNITEVYREQVPCPLYSSHSFWPILLKLYRCFKDGLKICMCFFFQNPKIIFYHFFCIFNLYIFLVLILQKRKGSRYLVPVTPTTVLSRSFWNFTDALKTFWRYACGFFRILKLFFITGFLLQYLGRWYRTNGPLVNLPIFNTSNKNKAGDINSPWNLLV